MTRSRLDRPPELLADKTGIPGACDVRLKLGRAQFPDGAAVALTYEAGDEGFGYAVGLARDCCSE
jgi:hypothetical protein